MIDCIDKVYALATNFVLFVRINRIGEENESVNE